MITRWLTAVLLLLAACDDLTRAAEPVWDRQPCKHCHMLISDRRYAAQLVTQKNERLHFDDPGCLAAYMDEHSSEVARSWVHMDGDWVRTEDARFSRSDSSPMGYGLLADRGGLIDFSAVMRTAMARRDQGAR